MGDEAFDKKNNMMIAVFHSIVLILFLLSVLGSQLFASILSENIDYDYYYYDYVANITVNNVILPCRNCGQSFSIYIYKQSA